MSKTLPTLYSRTSTGAIQRWTIQADGDAYRTVHGQVDGKLQTTEWMICFPKNEGKANATTAEEQALKEAEAIWRKKKETGYFENIDDIDIEIFTEPMLADPFEKRQKTIKYPVSSQPKLDGCLHGDTLVKTANGDVKIKDIEIGAEVYTYNENNQEQELKPVLGVYKNGVDINESNVEWFMITFEDDRDIILTGNHRVWIDDLKCWRRVDRLDGTEKLKLFHRV